MKQRDFIFTGLQPWDIPFGSNAIDIAKEIAKSNRVLYVNSALDQMTLWKNEDKPENRQRIDVLKKRAAPIRHISDNLWVLDYPFTVLSINSIPDGYIFDYFNKKNNQKLFRYIKKIANELGFKDIIHFIDNDIYRSQFSKDILKPALSIYYRRDNLHPFLYWKKHAPRLEPQIIAKSDYVLCNSPQLQEFALKFNKKSFNIGQGLDLSAYDADTSYPLQKEFNSVPRPVIGYIGDITSARLDPDLLYELAKSKPDYSFVMIGGEDKVFESHQLHELNNIHFFGKIQKETVPAYMSAFDVCINPQKLNEITIGNYPRKVDEYLAMGKPVVATRTMTMELFREHTYLCSGLKEYQDALDKALAENSEEKRKERIAFANSHSWENNVKSIYQIIDKK